MAKKQSKFDFSGTIAYVRGLIQEEVGCRNVAVIDDDGENIVLDDFTENRIRHFRMAPMTPEWLSSKIVWGPSIQDHWTLMPLRAILILGDDEDVEALSEAVNAEPCEFPDYEDVLGVKWHYKSSLVINLITLRECAEEEAEECGGDGCCCPILREEFLLTLLHELRHLGADNRDFLPDALAQTMGGSEDAVEAWAREIAAQQDQT